MGRPRNTAPRQLADGRFQAGLPVEHGAKKRKTYTFPTEAGATAWLREGNAALAAGRCLPDPAPFRAANPAPRAATLTPATAGAATLLSVVCDDYHQLAYEARRKGVKRSRQVRADIDNHLLPYFHGIGIHEVADVTHRSVVDLARFLSGWPLQHHIYEGDNPRQLEATTASRILALLRHICDHAVVVGALTTNPVGDVGPVADGPSGGSKRKTPGAELTLSETAALAHHLPVVHQLTLWLLRLLGLRLSEAFGIKVEHVEDLGDYGLIDIARQGGGTYQERDEHGQYVTEHQREATKREASRRVLWAPPVLMQLIRIIIEAYHTDPDTGQVRRDARLIPGLQEQDRAGKHTFRTALKQAAGAAGIEEDELETRLTPHHLRRSLATTVAYEQVTDEVSQRMHLGHQAGQDVRSRHYLLKDPRHRELKRIAEHTETQVREIADDLIAPTSKSVQWGRQNPIRRRLDYVQIVLGHYGWQVPLQDAGSEWLTVAETAKLLGMHPTKVRERMADGRIPAEQRPWGTRYCWHARREDVEAYLREVTPEYTLEGIAKEVGLTYHQAYEQLKRLGAHPHRKPGSRALEVTAEHLQLLRAEQHRVRCLHERAMPLPEAAAALQRSERRTREVANAGGLEVDPETDASGVRFVTRRSVQRLLDGAAQPDVATRPADTLSLQEIGERTGLSRTQVKRLIDAGHLEAVANGRSLTVTTPSLVRWATGFRPDLLANLPHEEVGTV
jgi:excisionase family DNA binding protein